MSTLNCDASVAFLTGRCVVQSAMPSLVNQIATRKTGSCTLVPIELGGNSMSSFLDCLRHAENVPGGVVTAPFEHILYHLVDHRTRAADRVGSADLFWKDPDNLIWGDTVLGAAFVSALAKNARVSGAETALVLGAGCPGSSVAAALLGAGYRTVDITDPVAAKAQSLAVRLGAPARTVSMPSSVDFYDLIVDATMTVKCAQGVHDLTGLRSETCVADLRASATLPPLLERARDLGANIQCGSQFSGEHASMVAERFGWDTSGAP